MRFGLREMIFILVLLAMPVAAYIFVFEPRNAQIAELRREIQQKQQKLAQLEAATRSINDLGQEIDRLSEAVTLFEQKLPQEREVEVILKEIWELAAKHKLVPKSVRTDKPVISPTCAELPIRLVIQGDFDGYYSFMLDLEKLRRITRNPQMTLRKESKAEGAMTADMVLSIFFEAQKGATPTVGGNRL